MARPETIEGTTYVVQTGCGKMYITINEIDGKPYEVFVRLGKAGGCPSSQSEALGRLVSLHLRTGTSIERISSELVGISCHKPAWGADGNQVLSCADAIGKILYNYTKQEIQQENLIQEGCPECGSKLIRVEGCMKCISCDYSKC